MSRTKGTKGEREVCAVLRDAGFDVDRVPNSGGLRIPGDVYGNFPMHLEVKRAERLKIPEWIRQAEDECDGRVPVVAFRQNGGKWYACLPLVELARLLK